MVEQGVEGARLDPEGVAAWMHSLNAVRLVLGERLSQEGLDLADPSLDDLPGDDDVLARVEVYEWLGMVLGDLVETAMATLPEGDDDLEGPIS